MSDPEDEHRHRRKHKKKHKTEEKKKKKSHKHKEHRSGQEHKKRKRDSSENDEKQNLSGDGVPSPNKPKSSTKVVDQSDRLLSMGRISLDKMMIDELISQIDVKRMFKDIYEALYELLASKSTEDQQIPLKIDRKIEDYIRPSNASNQIHMWIIEGIVMKVNQSPNSSGHSSEAEMSASIDSFVMKDLTFTPPEIHDKMESTEHFRMFLDFITEYFFIYRRTVILLEYFELIITGKFPENSETHGQCYSECVSKLKIYHDSLKQARLEDGRLEDVWEVNYVQSFICRPLYAFQVRYTEMIEQWRCLIELNHGCEDATITGMCADDETTLKAEVEAFVSFLNQGPASISEQSPSVRDRFTRIPASLPRTSSRLEDSKAQWASEMRRHMFLMKTAHPQHHSGSSRQSQSSHSIVSPQEMQGFRENSRFVWDDDAEPSTWGERIAKKYYDRLFKEYALIDMSRYTENKFGMRWRLERDLHIGKGQFVCGEVNCAQKENLTSWEVLFTYTEKSEKKSTLVKVRLCEGCSPKLNHYRQHRRKAKQSRHFNSSVPFNIKLEDKDPVFEVARQKKSRLDSMTTSGEFKCPDDLQKIWNQPFRHEDVNENIEQQLDDFLDSILD